MGLLGSQAGNEKKMLVVNYEQLLRAFLSCFTAKNLIFPHENMKKQPSQVAHNLQPAIFFIVDLAAQKAHFRQK